MWSPTASATEKRCVAASMILRGAGIACMLGFLGCASGAHPRAVAGPDDVRGLEEPPGIDPEDVALFVPRLVLYLPARVVGLVAHPVRAAMSAVERNQVVERIMGVFSGSDDGTPDPEGAKSRAGIAPVITLSTLIGTQIGVKAFHRDLGGHGESGSLKATWGFDREHSYTLSFSATRLGGSPVWVESKTAFEEHPKLRFYGFGGLKAEEEASGADLDPRGASVKSFYAHQRFRQLLTLGATLGEEHLEGQVGARGRLKGHRFDKARGRDKGDRDLSWVYDIEKVPGYEFGGVVTELEAVAAFHVSDPADPTGHSIHGEAFGGGALPFGEFGYGHYGVEVSGRIDLYGGDRILRLRLALESVERSDDKILFAELPSLGGADRLRGYPLSRYRDEKVLFGTVEYRYPIHRLITAAIFVDTGQAARNYEELFTNGVRFGAGGSILLGARESAFLTLSVAGGDGVQVYLTTDPLHGFTDRDDEL